ncbi:inositol monophosphatase family protein [Bythopirellula polymerisocia]|uniref:Inositol-1-monophosphatase n=1 Tax=Bythopirellula polymerisocia TaxID=2528003 RepID=A0A5C6CYJ8_9BACT|nr:inositol monophosphatase family protein [Bythopirellula polymerisocia]TWU28551.1 Inositol-1-monophosphatase [Bythopirellula polymerisocia]
MPESTELLVTCELAARRGAEELIRWRSRFTTREKSAHDLVTDSDLASQKAIHEVISSAFPEHGFLGEESPDPTQLEEPYCWVVDPLDGTTNYVHGFPCYCVSVAVAEAGRVVAGVVFDPIANNCFKAALGQGSWLNGEPIRISRETDLSRALVAVSFPPEIHPDSPDIQAFLRISPACQAVRRTGSAALNLSYVACGWLDAHWAAAIHSWDSAAGVLLVAEAGGVVGSFAGNEYQLAQGDYCVASSPELFDQVQALLK